MVNAVLRKCQDFLPISLTAHSHLLYRDRRKSGVSSLNLLHYSTEKSPQTSRLLQCFFDRRLIQTTCPPVRQQANHGANPPCCHRSFSIIFSSQTQNSRYLHDNSCSHITYQMGCEPRIGQQSQKGYQRRGLRQDVHERPRVHHRSPILPWLSPSTAASSEYPKTALPAYH